MKKEQSKKEVCSRFLAKVVKELSGCWRWTGYFRDGGHGGFRFRGASWKAHRVSFVLFREEIPEGLIVRHLCHNKWCVNPQHLAIGTPKDNSLDCVKAGRRKQEMCKKGLHFLTEDNVIIYRKTGGRSCRTCTLEYARNRYHLRRQGLLPLKEKSSDKDRFLSFIDRENNAAGCWKWIGNVQHHGYGTFAFKNAGFKSKAIRAHRASYILFKGDIPQGMLVRHLCNNKLCVNPDHLELGTAADNSRDYKEAGYGRSTHCRSGNHLLEGENLYVDPDGGRHCRACENERMRTPEGTYQQRLNRWKRLGKVDAEKRASIPHFRDRLTHCKRGHPFTEENTFVTSEGERGCKECRRSRQQSEESKLRRKAGYLKKRYNLTDAQAEELIASGLDGRRDSKYIKEFIRNMR